MSNIVQSEDFYVYYYIKVEYKGNSMDIYTMLSDDPNLAVNGWKLSRTFEISKEYEERILELLEKDQKKFLDRMIIKFKNFLK